MGRRPGGAGEHGRRRMARTTTRYVCQKCGHEEIRWLGRCPDCSSWNSFTEEVTVPRGAPSLSRLPGEQSAAPQRITEVSLDDHPRLPTGLGEFDRVLGGGIVPGSLVLIGGDPGIGKSTLVLQTAASLAREKRSVLYASGEESERQIRLRADRLNAKADRLYVLSETNLDAIIQAAERLDPGLLIVDSIQTVF